MALPAALPFVGKVAAWTGLSKAVTSGGSRIIPKLRQAGGSITGRFAGGAAAGGTAGYGIASAQNSLSDTLGIGDGASRIILFGVFGLAVIYVVGQLFDIQIGG